mmetsp:Transcript_25092/g.94838  ORF Transcript_25092/g.94838 Transcript_25092/m.94838 type:complete len:399 (-) Transcript_25092:794-1990(-)
MRGAEHLPVRARLGGARLHPPHLRADGGRAHQRLGRVPARNHRASRRREPRRRGAPQPCAPPRDGQGGAVPAVPQPRQLHSPRHLHLRKGLVRLQLHDPAVRAGVLQRRRLHRARHVHVRAAPKHVPRPPRRALLPPLRRRPAADRLDGLRLQHAHLRAGGALGAQRRGGQRAVRGHHQRRGHVPGRLQPAHALHAALARASVGGPVRAGGVVPGLLGQPLGQRPGHVVQGGGPQAAGEPPQLRPGGRLDVGGGRQDHGGGHLRLLQRRQLRGPRHVRVRGRPLGGVRLQRAHLLVHGPLWPAARLQARRVRGPGRVRLPPGAQPSPHRAPGHGAGPGEHRMDGRRLLHPRVRAGLLRPGLPRRGARRERGGGRPGPGLLALRQRGQLHGPGRVRVPA